MQLARDCGQRLLACFVLHCRVAGDYVQTLYSRQNSRQRLGHAIGEVVLGGIAGEVLQRQHRECLDLGLKEKVLIRSKLPVVPRSRSPEQRCQA